MRFRIDDPAEDDRGPEPHFTIPLLRKVLVRNGVAPSDFSQWSAYRKAGKLLPEQEARFNALDGQIEMMTEALQDVLRGEAEAGAQ